MTNPQWVPRPPNLHGKWYWYRETYMHWPRPKRVWERDGVLYCDDGPITNGEFWPIEIKQPPV